MIAEKLEQLEGIVSRVLSFARAPAALHARWSVHDIINDTLWLLKAKTAQANVAVRYTQPAPPLHVSASKGQVQQVLLNLILNSLHAMPQGGELAINCAATTVDQVWIDLADTGGGLPDEIRGRLFESFLSGRAGGTGLGLSIAKRIMLDHRGDLLLVATGPQGTTMRLVLPLAAG